MKTVTCKYCLKSYPKAAMENQNYCSTECIFSAKEGENLRKQVIETIDKITDSYDTSKGYLN